MKKIIAGAAIAVLSVAATLAVAGSPLKGADVKLGKIDDCAAKASSSSSLNKLTGGLSHSTEKCAGTASSGALPGSIPATDDKSASGTAMTVTGTMDATSSSASSTPQPQNVLKIKTKSNIKNDRVASSSSESASIMANSAQNDPH